MHQRSKIQTKSDYNSKKIIRLIFAIAFVFVILGFIYSLSNFSKSYKFKFNFLNKKVVVDDNLGPAWILDSKNLLTTKDGHEIFVQIASSSKDLADGLSFKDKLKFYERKGKITTEGMLFVFEEEMVQSFWMKDMNFDLDMIWLDSNYKIVHIEKNTLASSYNPTDTSSSRFFTNGPDHLAKYVLEINSGLSDEMGLKDGDVLVFN
ncbi:MAG: DUF192 domain-containing protein [Candidatus Paceibacterota bacterium]|jgi:uncharacterized membrane protein (UPF0127 family)